MLGTTPVSSQEFSLLHKLLPTGFFPLALQLILDFPGGSDGKVSAYNVGDPGFIPGLGRSSGEGNGNLLQYSCLENPMDGGAWWAWSMGLQRVGHD